MIRIRPPSREFWDLDPGLRLEIEGILSKHPVKVGAIADRLGVKVRLSTLPRGISGRIGLEGGIFVIFVNRHEAKPRQRFVAAHSLAHVLLHRDRLCAAGGWQENVLLRARGQPVEIEYEANRLALDLIIPEPLLAVAVAGYAGPLTCDDVEALARQFRVPMPVMDQRLT